MTGIYQRPDLSIDRQHALFTAARNLTGEFSGVFGTETIDRFLHTSYDQFADRATVTDFLPLLAERFARQRLQALARIEGKDTSGPRSAGRHPAADLELAIVKVMNEINIDLAADFPKPLTDELVLAADVIITLGCGEACPIIPLKRYCNWPVADPAGQPLTEIRRIRDELDLLVTELVNTLATDPFA